MPYYSTNLIYAYAIEERMQHLGRLEQYKTELYRLTRSKSLPSFLATPEQLCRAAIKAVGQYGQVISLSRGRNKIQR